jgi:hypothetical protein
MPASGLSELLGNDSTLWGRESGRGGPSFHGLREVNSRYPGVLLFGHFIGDIPYVDGCRIPLGPHRIFPTDLLIWKQRLSHFWMGPNLLVFSWPKGTPYYR